jgi:hypothetical protein
MGLSMRPIAPVIALLACPAIFVVACSSGHAAGPEVRSKTGPAVSARLNGCFIAPSLRGQAVAKVTAVNHSGKVHDIIVTIRISTTAGTRESLAVVHRVGPGRSGNGVTTNHLAGSHQPACVITGVKGL